jgi:hypothetical protein
MTVDCFRTWFCAVLTLCLSCGGGAKEDGETDGPDTVEPEDTVGDEAALDQDAEEEGEAGDVPEEDIPLEPRELRSAVLLGEGGFFGVSGRDMGNAAGAGFAIAAHYADISDGTGEEQQAGRLYFFAAGAFPSTLDDSMLVLQPPDGAPGGGFGYAIGEPCDFNGDGHLDLAVGNHLYSDAACANCGRVVVFWGDAAGLSMERATYHRLSDGLRSDSDCLGQTVLCGDFDGDGFDDLLATGQNGGLMNTGIGAVYHGSETGLPETQDAEIYPALARDRQYFGCSSLWEDLDGDGETDLAVGGWGLIKGTTGPHTGGVAVFPGGENWSAGPAYVLSPETDAEAGMGTDMTIVLASGRMFLAVSAPDDGAAGEGAVLVFEAGAPGFHESPPVQVLTAPGGVAGTGYGNAIAFVPDFHGADRGALLVGMKYADADAASIGTGVVAVYALAPEGGPFEETAAIITAPAPAPNDAFGGAVVPLEVVDGDGLRDFLVGMESHVEGDIMTGVQTGGVVFFH